MGMSGAEAALGTCPAEAYCSPASVVATNKAVKIEERFILLLRDRVGGSTGFRVDLLHRRHLSWRGRRRRQWLADRQSHRGDLLLLGNDDLLGQPPALRVATVAKIGDCHFDRALLV